jgi:uncharacterized membrane protein YdjX (TVP38/TMEM64 family)
VWRFVFFVALLVILGIAVRFTPLSRVTDQEWLLATLEHLRDGVGQSWWAPVALIAAFALLCPLGFPITPFWITGGVLFGVVEGSLYNLVGSVLGAGTSYFFARSFGRELIEHLVGDRLKPFESRLNRRGFWTLVGTRFLPVPFPVANFGFALVGVRIPAFVLSTLVGMVLPVGVWTWFWTTLADAAAGKPGVNPAHVILALVPFLLLIFLPQAYMARQRKKRYREILQGRAGRSNRGGRD